MPSPINSRYYIPFPLSLSKGHSEEGWFDKLTTNVMIDADF